MNSSASRCKGGQLANRIWQTWTLSINFIPTFIFLPRICGVRCIPFDFVRDAPCTRCSSAAGHLGLSVETIDRRDRLHGVKVNRFHKMMSVCFRRHIMKQDTHLRHYRQSNMRRCVCVANLICPIRASIQWPTQLVPAVGLIFPDEYVLRLN